MRSEIIAIKVEVLSDISNLPVHQHVDIETIYVLRIDLGER